MDCRLIGQLNVKFDGIICGFCLPYLDGAEVKNLITDCKNLLHENGILYLSFVAGDENQSGFQIGSSGDRMCFHFHSETKIQQLLLDNGFEKPETQKVSYEKAHNEFDIHTIILAKKQSVV